nr:hypothetical protein [uncultured Duganella sp.]
MLSIAKRLLALALLLSGGCTTVYVENGVINRAPVFTLGGVSISPSNTEPLIVRTTGLGLTIGSHATTLGWVNEVVITAPDTSHCRVYMFVQTKEERVAIEKYLALNARPITNICIFPRERPNGLGFSNDSN